MIINGTSIPLEDDIGYILDYYEEQVVSYYQEPTLANIRQSLNALGYDVDSQADRVNSLINILIVSDEWDVVSAVSMMEALEDDWITEAEVNTIMEVDVIVPIIIPILDDDEKDAEDEEEEVVVIITNEDDDPWWNWSPIDWIVDGMVLEPLEAILVSVSKNVGERLEKFISYALGIEIEE